MKIILRQDVENLGDAGDVVDVKAGYARNYLVPQGMAVRASKGNLAQIEDLKRQSRRRSRQELEQAKETLAKLADLTVTVKALAGETGRLYGSVTNQDIGRVLAEEHDIDVDRRLIQQERPFGALGEFTVTIKLHAEMDPVAVPVVVEAENPEDVTRLGEDERELRAESFGIASPVGESGDEAAGEDAPAAAGEAQEEEAKPTGDAG